VSRQRLLGKTRGCRGSKGKAKKRGSGGEEHKAASCPGPLGTRAEKFGSLAGRGGVSIAGEDARSSASSLKRGRANRARALGRGGCAGPGELWAPINGCHSSV
jgi:hypothetical protein